jgi:hypothetical protein
MTKNILIYEKSIKNRNIIIAIMRSRVYYIMPVGVCKFTWGTGYGA